MRILGGQEIEYSQCLVQSWHSYHFLSTYSHYAISLYRLTALKLHPSKTYGLVSQKETIPTTIMDNVPVSSRVEY